MYGGIMSRLEIIVEDLKSLPPQKLEIAANYIQRLRATNESQRHIVLARTSGSLPDEVASAIETEIEEGCERIDERGW
jgi:hypothetical protein